MDPGIVDRDLQVGPIGRPLVVVDGTDDVVAANKTGLDVLAAHDGEITATEAPEGVVVTAVAGTSRHLLAWPGDGIG